MMNDEDDGDKEENERETLDWMGKEYSYDDDGNFDGDEDDAYAQDGDDGDTYDQDGDDGDAYAQDGDDDDAYAQDGDDDDGERETLDSSICVGKEGENPGKPVNTARRPYLNMHTAKLVMITILMMILILKEKKMEAS